MCCTGKAGLCLPLRIVAYCENFRCFANFFQQRSLDLRKWIFVEHIGTTSIDWSMRASDSLLVLPLNQLLIQWLPLFIWLFSFSANPVRNKMIVLKSKEFIRFWLYTNSIRCGPKSVVYIRLRGDFVSFVFIGWGDTICSRSVTCSANRSPRIDFIFAFKSLEHQRFSIKSMDDELGTSLIHEDIDSLITGKSPRRWAVRVTGNGNIAGTGRSSLHICVPCSTRPKNRFRLLMTNSRGV